MTVDQAEYITYWTTVTGRSPHEVYVPLALREGVVTMDACPAGGNHTPGTSGEWKGRCTKCGQPC